MMKYKFHELKVFYFITVILLFTAGINYPQQTATGDVLPLSIGNKWVYNYKTNSYSSMSHSSTTEYGTIEYEILGYDNWPEGILWHFKQRKNAVRDVYGIGTFTVIDSSLFDLVELNNTFHEIYSITFNSFSVFPFQRSNADSSKYFRYKGSITDTDVPFKIEYPDPGNPPYYYNFKYNYTLRKDVGIVQLKYNKNGMLSGASSEYTLKQFNQTIIVGIHNEPAGIPVLLLMQNYPNPFNPATIISYQIPVSGLVQLKVFNALGQEIAFLVNENKYPGKYEVKFNASKYPSGIYLYQIKCGNFIMTKKMLLLK